MEIIENENKKFEQMKIELQRRKNSESMIKSVDIQESIMDSSIINIEKPKEASKYLFHFYLFYFSH